MHIYAICVLVALTAAVIAFAYHTWSESRLRLRVYAMILYYRMRRWRR